MPTLIRLSISFTTLTDNAAAPKDIAARILTLLNNAGYVTREVAVNASISERAAS